MWYWLKAYLLSRFFFKNPHSPGSSVMPVRFERVEQSLLDKSFGGISCALPISDGAGAVNRISRSVTTGSLQLRLSQLSNFSAGWGVLAVSEESALAVAFLHSIVRIDPSPSSHLHQ